MKFGKYTLLDRISHGGMAEVYRAKTFGAAGFERIVAIKLLLPNIAMDSAFVTMLIDEAKIAGQLSHANIAQIFDLGMAEGRYYIVQEHVSGLDIRTILRRLAKSGRRLSVAQAVHIILKVCEGLEYAHTKRDGTGKPLNLVHRDVSPQNILVSGEGEVKLIDFGIAKAEGRATRTLAGLVKGKFAYMSPEQIRGLPVDRRSDVFATGIVLHELLTNKPLFKRKSEFETLKRARSGVIDPPSKLNPEVPTELDDIVLHALARHVEDRYKSALELRDALWQFSRSSGNFYSRNQLAAWMVEEIASEEAAKAAKPDSGEFPLIEVSGPGQDSQPTVVDLSGSDRDSAELSGEVKQETGKSERLTRPEKLVDQPSIEISGEVLESDLAVLPVHSPVEAEERPTLLFEPGESPLAKAQLSGRMTAQLGAQDAERLTTPIAATDGGMTAPSAAAFEGRMTAPVDVPPMERATAPVATPASIDVPTSASESRRTLLAASVPIAPVGQRHPAAPVTRPPVNAPSPAPSVAMSPTIAPDGMGFGSPSPAGSGAGVMGGPMQPMGGPTQPPGGPTQPPGGPTQPPGGPTQPPSRSNPRSSGFAPPGHDSTAPPLAHRPKISPPREESPGGNSKLLLVFAILVLAGAIAVTVTLVLTQ